MAMRKPAVEARRVDGALVATFNRARQPLIWRFDLERHHSFTLALQGEEGDWELGMTSLKGEFYPIVSFAAREDADEAFACIAKILARSKKRNWFSIFLKLIAVILVLFIILIGSTVAFVSHEVKNAITSGGGIGMMMQSGALGTGMPGAGVPGVGMPGAGGTGDNATDAKSDDVKTGVPLSADDVLRPQQ